MTTIHYTTPYTLHRSYSLRSLEMSTKSYSAEFGFTPEYLQGHTEAETKMMFNGLPASHVEIAPNSTSAELGFTPEYLQVHTDAEVQAMFSSLPASHVQIPQSADDFFAAPLPNLLQPVEDLWKGITSPFTGLLKDLSTPLLIGAAVVGIVVLKDLLK